MRLMRSGWLVAMNWLCNNARRLLPPVQLIPVALGSEGESCLVGTGRRNESCDSRWRLEQQRRALPVIHPQQEHAREQEQQPGLSSRSSIGTAFWSATDGTGPLPRPAQAGKTVEGPPVRFVLKAKAPGALCEEIHQAGNVRGRIRSERRRRVGRRRDGQYRSLCTS